MDIELKKVKVSELYDGYVDEDDEGVVAYGGKLDVRPIYQRLMIYNDDQKKAVIKTILESYPLNVMYWADNGNGKYEIIDGQQRTLSICQFMAGDFSINNKFYHSLKESEKRKIQNYRLDIYVCKGAEEEKLDWFKTINIAGEKLSLQELRNAVYSGSWIVDAKKYFSRKGQSGAILGGKYIKANVERQDLLERAIQWRVGSNNIDEYMSEMQNDPNAKDLWDYFQKVIEWVKDTFPEYRSIMKGIDWAKLYEAHKNKEIDASATEDKISELIEDSSVTNQQGIYIYVLDGKEANLQIRRFDNNDRRAIYEKQKGLCNLCKEVFNIEDMEADHIKAWSKGGETIRGNCQMLCKDCNRRKSNK